MLLYLCRKNPKELTMNKKEKIRKGAELGYCIIFLHNIKS